MRNRSMLKQLRFEALEAKRPLAGDVTAVLNGDDLVITGDALGNGLELTDGPVANSFELTPLGATNINQTLFYNVTGDVIADFGDGNDGFNIDAATIQGSVKIDLGATTAAGVDAVSFRNGSTVGGSVKVDASDTEGSQLIFDSLDVAGDLVVETGTLSNSIQFGENADVTVGDDVRIVGAAGDVDISFLGNALVVSDDFKLSASSGEVSLAGDELLDVGDDMVVTGDNSGIYLEASGFSVGDDLLVVGGAGDDAIGVFGATIGDTLRVFARGGDDGVFTEEAYVGTAAFISLGAGEEDTAELFDSDFGYSLTVVGLGGNSITLDNVATSHFIDIVTFSGEDSVTLRNGVTTHTAWISLGGGDDELEIAESTFDYLFALLGSGDDAVTLEGVTVERFGVLSGGWGDDELNFDAATTDEVLFYFGFESVNA